MVYAFRVPSQFKFEGARLLADQFGTHGMKTDTATLLIEKIQKSADRNASIPRPP